jgi:hypothetical protein
LVAEVLPEKPTHVVLSQRERATLRQLALEAPKHGTLGHEVEQWQMQQ